MEVTDSTHFGLLAAKVGLVSQAQVAEATTEAVTECGKKPPDLPFLVRAMERKGWITNFQTSKLLKGDLDGYFAGGYRILYKIQSGSFGRVFRADDPRTGRVVAVKILRRRWSEDQQRIDLFVREGKVGLTLKHPNIVEVLAINQDPQSRQYYLVMEFVEGGNLREILQRRKVLRLEECLRILEDAATGLAYAYSRGITHRDIKLTNILINTQGDQAKLTDFGLAQMFSSMSREDEHVDRTVDYAGLEKATNVKSGDVRSDIFFLGCVFFECLTGRSPLEMSKDRHARMSARRFQEMQSLKPGEIDAPASVYTLLETVMAFDPKRRYQTPNQLVEAVKAVRREVAAGGTGAKGEAKSGPKSVFLAEADTNLQDKFREALKQMGYRVFLAADPARALDRFRQQPYDAFLVNVSTTGEDGLIVFERILTEARSKGIKCACIAMFDEDQADAARQVQTGPHSAVLVRPISGKQLYRKLKELTGS